MGSAAPSYVPSAKWSGCAPNRELIRIHSESVPPVNRIDVDRSNFDDCLAIVFLVASRDLAADACSDGKCGCRRNHLVGENGRLVHEHPSAARGISHASFHQSRLWLIGQPAS
jgi:hypothetical protein